MYFLMVDRFRNGNPKNDAPLNDKDVDKKLNFQGGDLQWDCSRQLKMDISKNWASIHSGYPPSLRIQKMHGMNTLLLTGNSQVIMVIGH